MTTYQGWTNYETWATNLWLGNEYGVYQRICWELKDVIASDGMDYGRGAEVLEAFVTGEVLAPDEGDSMLAEGVSGMAGDLLESAISSVDWLEIATAWMDDLDAERSAA